MCDTVLFLISLSASLFPEPPIPASCCVHALPAEEERCCRSRIRQARITPDRKAGRVLLCSMGKSLFLFWTLVPRLLESLC